MRLEDLLELNRYVELNAPASPFGISRDEVLVYIKPFERVAIRFESTLDLAYGLHRDDVLADEHGIDSCESDTRLFAEGLLAAILPKVSEYQLEKLVAVFSLEYERTKAERLARTKLRN